MFRQGNHAETLAGLMNLLQVHTGSFITMNHMGMPFFCNVFWKDRHKMAPEYNFTPSFFQSQMCFSGFPLDIFRKCD